MPGPQRLEKCTCRARHWMNGPRTRTAFSAIATKYKGHSDRVNGLSGKIKAGGRGVWAAMAISAQASSTDESAQLHHWRGG